MKNNPLRTLARSEYWLQYYRASKELNGIELFKNKDLSRLQIIFLSYLNLYDSIYTDISSNMLDGSLMDENRIKDDMLVDAYLTAKRKNRYKKKDKKEDKPNFSGIPSIRFIGKKEKRR